MYKELEKYKTGNKVSKKAVFKGIGEVEIDLDEYIFPVGELIKDLIKHESKCRFRRKFYHKRLTEIYIEILDEVKITKGF